MTVASVYAKSLADITKADETLQIKAGVDAALAAASTLSAALAPQASPAITAFSPPVSAAVVWAFGQYQDQVKLNALRKATAKMDRVLQAVVEKLRGSASVASAVDQDRLVLEYQAKRAAFQDAPTPTATALEEMLAAAAKLDVVQKSQPQEVFEQMAVAHGALTKALIAKDTSFADAWKQIESFVAKAKELAKIVESFAEAAKPE
jgi:hypothetical protein